MWRSGIVLASFLILPTVVSIYSKNRLKNVSNLGISTNSTLRKVRSQERPESKLPDYRYKEELSRELDKNLIAFIQNIIPSIKPKVNWMADSISDAVGVTQAKLLQTMANTNNTIRVVETFFNKMYQALVVNENDGNVALLEPSRTRRQRPVLVRKNKYRSNEVNRNYLLKSNNKYYIFPAAHEFHPFKF
ncbi:hypothetical protein Fcan01_07586 [Folsomia candida]|uniref:Uncharacterized protein n=1 Tax=Folsomia candida TaxID=158441 RepID=A0A226EIA8_FOLCA|nr:hypothetical protein Fcan01_07586 [Folsomia candida]